MCCKFNSQAVRLLLAGGCWNLFCTVVLAQAVPPAAASAASSVAMPTFVLAHTLAGHNRYVFAVAFSPDGRWLASSTSHGKIKLWEVSTGKEVRTLTGHTLAVYSVAFSPDGQQLVSAGRDATVTFWEVASGKSLRALKVAPVQFYAYSAAFSADGRWLAVGATGGAMRVWDAATGDCRCARLLTVGRTIGNSKRTTRDTVAVRQNPK